MKLFKKSIFAILLASVFIFSSCKKYEDLNKIAKTAWNPNLAIPLAHSKFGVYDILANNDSTDLLIIDPISGEIGLIYSSEIASINASSVVALGNLAHNVIFSLADLNIPTTPSLSPLVTINSFNTETVQLTAANGVELHHVLFKNGLLNLHFETTIKHDVNMSITFPNLTSNGTPLTSNILLTYTGSVPQIADLQIDLTNIDGDFTLGGTSFNQMNVDVQTAIFGTGQDVSGSENFTFDLSSSNLAFKNANGYFGQQNVAQVADSVLIKIFKNSVDGTFELNNSKINFTIDNSFGFPLDINLVNLRTINSATGVPTPLLNFPTTINVNYPTVMGQSAITNFELNDNNTSNLSSVISPTPKYFYYEINSIANPAGPTSDLNFVEDVSEFVLKADVNMPLDGLAYGFHISDTVDFEFKEDLEFIESIMFRLIVDNGFPVQLGTQIQALDENDVVLFSIYGTPETIVSPAPVNANGLVTSSVNKITDINLNLDQITKLSQVKKLVIYGEASTTEYQNGVNVKFYDFYQLSLKLAMQVQASTSF